MVMAQAQSPSVAGGRIVMEKGTLADYRRLAHLHYAPGDPATWAGVWRAVYRTRETLNIDQVNLLKL